MYNTSNHDCKDTIFIDGIPLSSKQYASLLRVLGERCHYRDWVIRLEHPNTYLFTEPFEYAYEMYEDTYLNPF